MGNSSDKPVESDEKVCLDLCNAARKGKLDEVTRLLPLAKAKGVVNKVMHGVNTQRERRGRGRGSERERDMTYSACHNAMFISSPLMCVCVRVRFQSDRISLHCWQLLSKATTRLFHSCWPRAPLLELDPHAV